MSHKAFQFTKYALAQLGNRNQLEHNVSRTPEPYDRLPQRLRDEIDSLNPSMFAKLRKEDIVKYLSEHGLPVTFWAVKQAVESEEIPTKRIGKARRASEFDVLVWAATRDLKQASA